MEAINEQKIAKIAEIEASTLEIKFLYGSPSISFSPQIFSGYIDPDVRNNDLSQSSIITEASSVFFRVVNRARFLEAFAEIKTSWEGKCLTEAQIVELAQSLPKVIKDQKSALVTFLCKKNIFLPIEDQAPWKNVSVIAIDFNSPGNPVYSWRLNYLERITKFIIVCPTFPGYYNF